MREGKLALAEAEDRLFPLVTAHTGCMGSPDNTLASARAGIASGADIVEDDVRVTRDGIPVLFHDDTVSLADGRSFRIAELRHADLIGLDVLAAHGCEGETIRIAELRALLEIARSSGKLVNLDLKTDEAVEAAAIAVRESGMEGRVFLTGCEAERALLAQSRAPWLPRLLNASADLFRRRDYSEAVAQTCRDASAASCAGINIHYRLVTEQLIDAAGEHGLPVYVWTVDDTDDMRRLAALGVRSITTRHVDVAAKLAWDAANRKQP